MPEDRHHRADAALDVLRVTTALLIFIHGVARVAGGGVEPFGG